MRHLVRYFFQGLLVFVPAVLTIAIVVFVFRKIDAWMGIPIPGAGFVALRFERRDGPTGR